jgi:thiol:disulfide interchange protein DsbD
MNKGIRLIVNAKHMLRLLAYCFAALSVGLFSTLSFGQSFLAPEKAFYIDSVVTNKNIVNVNFKIAPGYYMYQERFEFTLDNAPIVIKSVSFPPAKVKYDPTFEKDMGLYFKQTNISLVLSEWPQGLTNQAFVLKVVSQGCAVQGICYPPVTSALQIEAIDEHKGYRVISITDNTDDDLSPRAPTIQINELTSAQPQDGKTSPFSLSTVSDSTFSNLVNSADDSLFANALSTGSFWGNIALFFLLGTLLSLTPCVLPMIPILSVLIVGQGNAVTRTRGFSLAAAYVAGMSLIYTALGVLAGLSGAGLAGWLQTPWVLGIFASLLALMGLAMFDLVRIEMPQAIQTKLSIQASSMRGGKAFIAFVMGVISALIVGPCVAAPLAGALLYISQTTDVWLGGGALFAMSWGMGLPLLVLGASAGSLLPKTGAWMKGVKVFFGVLLFGTAWWMLSPVISAQTNLIGWAVLAIFSGMLLGTFEPKNQNQSILLQAIQKTIGFILMLLAMFWLIGALTGARSLINPLSQITLTSANISNSQISRVSQDGSSNLVSNVMPTFQIVDSVETLQIALMQTTKPVMLDFYADWCVSCKEMEAFTFPDPRVIERMKQMILLKADVTKNTVQQRALLKKFKLFGPPGIIFFDPSGNEINNIRVVGFQNADKFTQILDRVLSQTDKPQ